MLKRLRMADFRGRLSGPFRKDQELVCSERACTLRFPGSPYFSAGLRDKLNTTNPNGIPENNRTPAPRSSLNLLPSHTRSAARTKAVILAIWDDSDRASQKSG